MFHGGAKQVQLVVAAFKMIIPITHQGLSLNYGFFLMKAICPMYKEGF